MNALRYYVVNSSLFDCRPSAYDIAAFIARLRRRGLISRPRKAHAYGWSNQPHVLTFALARNVTPRDISQALSTLPALQGRAPIVRAVDW